MLPKHYKEPNVDVFPENWPAFSLYVRYQTQWLQGPTGATGLNYQILIDDLIRQGLDQEGIDEVMDGVRVIESAMLEHFYS